jgi:60 kDa SS-A/Ro ribonucleoprotein
MLVMDEPNRGSKMDYSKHVSTRVSPTRERTPGRTDEVQNSDGGFVHSVDNWDRLDRFLILGSEGGTYYVNERDLTKDNANATIALIKSDGLRVVNRVVEISKEGRAHKNDAALFVLAACAKLGNEATRKLAFGVLPEVARIGTHLFKFAQFVEAFGGWGRATKRGFQRWYNDKSADKLAYQLLKYRQRDGWSHRDILRLCHPVTTSGQHRAMYDVTAHPDKLNELAGAGHLPTIYNGFRIAHAMDGVGDGTGAAELIRSYNMSWEMLPTEWLKNAAVNKQLLINMPLMATIRQLGKMTANGTLKPLSPETAMVCERLVNDEQITRSKIHPMHYLLAAKTYASGQGFRGNSTWDVDGRVGAALNTGFYKSFKNVEPTGKAFLLGVDVSSSMRWNQGGSLITAAEAAAAMALVIAKTEPNHYIHGFSGDFVDLGISPDDNLAQAMAKTTSRNFGSTNCSLPMQHAQKHNLMVDTFVVITDNETNRGTNKPGLALQDYRRTHNPNAKLVVVAVTSTGFTIADPNDSGMLDVVGFDANVLPIIAEFSR